MPNRDGTGPRGTGRRNQGNRSSGRKGDCRRDGNRGGNRSGNQNSLGTSRMVTSAATALLGLAAASAPIFLKLRNLLSKDNQEQIAQSEKPIPKAINAEPKTLVIDENGEVKIINSE